MKQQETYQYHTYLPVGIVPSERPDVVMETVQKVVVDMKALAPVLNLLIIEGEHHADLYAPTDEHPDQYGLMVIFQVLADVIEPGALEPDGNPGVLTPPVAPQAVVDDQFQQIIQNYGKDA